MTQEYLDDANHKQPSNSLASSEIQEMMQFLYQQLIGFEKGFTFSNPILLKNTCFGAREHLIMESRHNAVDWVP